MIASTLNHLRDLKLEGMLAALEEQLSLPEISTLSFEERFAILVDREVHHRHDKRQRRLLKNAKLRYGQAHIEDLDAHPGRGITRRELTSLALGDWVSQGQSILIIGPTGVGKSWLACALAQYACRRGYSAIYQRVPRLQEELLVRHGSGTFGNWLINLAKTDVLILDDWGLGNLEQGTRSDLLEIIDDRAANKATIITSQLPIEHWHAWIGDGTIADAILDRIMQKNHRINLTGESLRTRSQKGRENGNIVDLS